RKKIHCGTNGVVSFFCLGVYILIAVGAVMMIVGFLGCYGAIQESQCLLGTVSEVAALQLSLSVTQPFSSLSLRSTALQLSLSVAQPLHLSQEKSINQSINRWLTGCLYMCPQLDCCGKGDDSPLFKQVAGALCPKKTQDDALLKPQSCHLKLKDLFSEKLCLIGLAALVVAVIMIFEMIFTMVLCCAIRNATPVY
ncbi:unnamed protein product, partial [Oncorhynchus mykiss]